LFSYKAILHRNPWGGWRKSIQSQTRSEKRIESSLGGEDCREKGLSLIFSRLTKGGKKDTFIKFSKRGEGKEGKIKKEDGSAHRGTVRLHRKAKGGGGNGKR